MHVGKAEAGDFLSVKPDPCKPHTFILIVVAISACLWQFANFEYKGGIYAFLAHLDGTNPALGHHVPDLGAMPAVCDFRSRGPKEHNFLELVAVAANVISDFLGLV